jgi:hypothetical protein
MVIIAVLKCFLSVGRVVGTGTVARESGRSTSCVGHAFGVAKKSKRSISRVAGNSGVV